MELPIIWNEDVNTIKGHLDDEARWKRPDLAPGTAAWCKGSEDDIATLNFVCPCGCTEVGTVPVKPGYGAHWQWDGDLVAPTLTPSILRCRPQSCGWHGFVTEGKFVTC